MNTPNDIKYTKEHEWVSLDEKLLRLELRIMRKAN